MIANNRFLLIVTIIYIKIQIAFQQSQSQCTTDPSKCCDSSCYRCSQDLISTCITCQPSYFYSAQQYSCLPTCPAGTYTINETKQCITCYSQQCLQCSDSECFQCKPGFIKDPNDKKNCISSCSTQNMILDDQGECNFGCTDDNSYDIDYQSNSCILKQACPSLIKNPQVVNKADAISTLLGNSKQLMTSIDKFGNVVLFSFPDLVEQLGYSLPVNTSTVAYCTYQDDTYLKNDIITCHLSPTYLISFFSSNGTVTFQKSINDRAFVKGLDSGRGWNLMQAQKDLLYELQFVNYSALTSVTLDSFSNYTFTAVTLKKPVSTTSTEVMGLNLPDGKVTYYKTSPYSKTLVYTSSVINLNAKLIQLNTNDFWIIYVQNSYQLVKFNVAALSMTLLQQQSIEDNINQIYLPNNAYDVIFVFGSSTLQLKLLKFDEQLGTLTAQTTNLNSQISNINYFNKTSDVLIMCSTTNTYAFQLTNANTQLKQIAILRERNTNLCSLSSFSSIKIDSIIYIYQIIQRNINLNMINTSNNYENTSNYVAHFADTSQVKTKLSDRVQWNYFLLESIEKQQVMEVKHFGMLNFYDPVRKTTVNSIRIWYPYNELVTQLFFNSVVMTDPLYLFVGFENNTFKLKIINLKTGEITYEQSMPEIAVPIEDLNVVYLPVYFPGSGSIIVHFIRKKLTVDPQKRYDFFFIQKNPDSTSPKKYKLVNSFLSIPAFNFLYALSSEVLMLFDLQTTQYYKAYFYTISGQKMLTIDKYYFKDPNRFGQVNEVTKKAYIFGYYQIVTVDLVAFTQTTANYSNRCLQSIFFNPDFTSVYLQDTCVSEGVYTYPDLTQRVVNSPANPNLFTYNYFGRYLVFKTFNPPQIIYDPQTNVIFRLSSIHGNNNGGLVQDTQGVFFNNLAVDHYDIVTQRFLFCEDNSIAYTFLLQTSKLRNNYAISNKLNLIQVKKYNELILSQGTDPLISGNQNLYISYIPEVNIIMVWTQAYIKLYDSISKTLLKKIDFTTTIINVARVNFVTQEVFMRKTFYYAPSNVIVGILYQTMVFINPQNQTIVQAYYLNSTLPYKSVVVDMELGYIISTNIDKDCIYNLNTLNYNCQKEISSYQGLPNQPMNDYTQELFINQKTRLVIICQMTSIRVLSLKDLKYYGSVYDANLDAALFFYNPYYHYVIYSLNKGLLFMLMDLNTISKKVLSLPIPSKDFQSTNYRFQFLSDQQNYLFVNSNYLAISTYNQVTHTLVNSIQLDAGSGFYPYSTWIIDEQRKYIFMLDYTNTVQHLSYDTNKLIYKYALNATDTSGIQKWMIWDNYKQKLIVCSRFNFFVISILKNLVEFAYLDTNDVIVQIQLIPNKNILQFSTYQSWVLLDYDYFMNDSKETYPNQIHPRTYTVNDNVIFHINNVNSQANLYVNKKIKDSWIRNNLMVGFIRMAENDLSNSLVYAIYDKEITILDLSKNRINQLDQQFHTQNIISILYEDNNYVYLQSQSQQILTLPKKSKTISINEAIVLPQGIAVFYFSKNSMKLIFTDFKSTLNINVVTFSLVQGVLIGTQSTPILMVSRIVHFNLLNDPQIVILLEDTLIVYDIVTMQTIKSIALPIKHLFSNVRVDLVYNRIFVQNQNSGSFVFDFSLVASPLVQINTFSSNIQFDQYFIYSITSHSANIYFRKDLQFLTHFRHFETNFALKKITYLGVGYLFMVEFISKLSVYELSSFGYLPIEKDFFNINQYNIFKQSLIKISSDPNESSYMFVASANQFVQNYQNLYTKGFTLEGLFTYSSKISLYNQQAAQTCSQSIPMQKQIYQEANIFNQLALQLMSQSRLLNRLSVPISNGQYIRLPSVPSTIISNKFDLSIDGNNDHEQIYVKDYLNQLTTITNLKFKKIKLSNDPDIYSTYVSDNKIPNSIDINQQKYPNLKSFMIERVILDEVSMNIENIPTINIKDIILQSVNSNNQKSTLTYLKVSNSSSAIISSITVSGCDFSLSKPLIDINNVASVIINKLTFTEGGFQSLSSIISLQNIKTLTIGDIVINQNTFKECSFLFASVINKLEINSLTIQNNVFNSVKQKRFLVALEQEIITTQLFDLSEMDTIKINNLTIDQFNANSILKLLIFQMKHIQTKLSINQSSIKNVSLQKGQSGVILQLTGINSVLLNDFYLDTVSNLQFIKLQEYKISKMYSFFSNIITIQNSKILSYNNTMSLIQTSSFIATIDNLLFKMINCISESNQQFPVIDIEASDELIIRKTNVNQIYQFYESFLKIHDSKNILIENSTFDHISSQGSGSTLSIINSNDVKIISNNFQNNQANLDSGVILFKNTISITIKNNKFKLNTSLNGQGGSIYSVGSKFDSIDENIFEDNQALKGSGGAIFCLEGSISSVQSNKFLENSAVNGSGGTFLLKNCDLLVLSSNEFNSNTAFIGGAIRYLILKPLFILNNSMNALQHQNVFKRNKCIAYGKDIGSYPTILDIKNSFDDDEDGNSSQTTQVLDVQSGEKAKNPIQLRFIDEEMKEINFIDLNQYPSVITDIKDEFSQYILQADSDQIGLTGDLKQGYNRESYSFQFNITYSYQPKSSSYIIIKSTQALPQFINKDQQMVQQQFELKITIQFRECQVGEVQMKTGQYELCQTCESGFYSLVDPYSSGDVTCLRCPIGSLSCKGSQIKISNGYWRKNENSDVLVSCGQNEINCQPENVNSKQGCTEGHMGPLCSQCDVLAEVWGKQYALVNEFDCMDCTKFSNGINVTLFILVFAFILSQIFGKAYKQVTVTKKFIIAVYLAKIGLISPNIEKVQTISASLMKILLNYFQFVMIVNSLDIYLPSYFAVFNLSGGDTSQQTINRIDCFLFGYKTGLPNYIVRLLWVNSQPLVLFLFLEILSQFTLQKSQVSAQRQTLYTNLIIVFSFFQPSITKVISQSFSCIRIGDQSYILADMNERCLTDDHLYYFYTTLVPLGLLWIFFGPLFLFYRMSHYKNKMNNIKTMYRYGYLYQEYNHKHYYWDILRMFIRSFAIISINMLSFKVLFKGLIILGLIFLYMILSSYKKPYHLERFNKLDRESCSLVIITLYLLYIGYLSENEIISFITSVIAGVVNGKFVLKMLQLIFIKPISPIESDRNKFQQIVYNLKIKIPLLLIWVEIRNPNRTRAFLNWKKVRRQVNSIRDMNRELDSRRQTSVKRNTSQMQMSNMYMMSSQRKLEAVKQYQNNNDSSFDSPRQHARSRMDTQRQKLMHNQTDVSFESPRLVGKGRADTQRPQSIFQVYQAE